MNFCYLPNGSSHLESTSFVICANCVLVGNHKLICVGNDVLLPRRGKDQLSDSQIVQMRLQVQQQRLKVEEERYAPSLSLLHSCFR